MCDACARFVVAGAPSCTACAYEVATRTRRRTSFAVVLAFVTIAFGAVVGGRFASDADVILGIALACTGALAWAAWLLPRRGDASLRVVARAEGEHLGTITDTARPRRLRTAARRIMVAVAPAISARHTVLALVLTTAFVLFLIPALLSLPRFLELEIAIVLAFVVLSAVFATLLFRGYRLEEDHVFVAPGAPWTPLGPGASRAPKDSWLGTPGCEDTSGCGYGLVEGLVILFAALVASIALGMLAAVAWAVVEVLLPIAFLAVYEIVVFGLRRVANDRHDCQGRLPASVAWGAAWAALYALPLGLVVTAFHALHVFIRHR